MSTGLSMAGIESRTNKRIMVSKQVQIMNMKINKQLPVSTNYNDSYFNHTARYPTGQLDSITGYTTSMQQRMRQNLKVGQCVKQSPEKQHDMGLTKWKHEPAPTTGLALLVVYLLQTDKPIGNTTIIKLGHPFMVSLTDGMFRCLAHYSLLDKFISGCLALPLYKFFKLRWQEGEARGEKVLQSHKSQR